MPENEGVVKEKPKGRKGPEEIKLDSVSSGTNGGKRVKTDEMFVQTEDKIALIIVYLFVGTVGGSFLYFFLITVLAYRNLASSGCLDWKNLLDSILPKSFELLKNVSALMSGPLGFVLGYYFTTSQKEK